MHDSDKMSGYEASLGPEASGLRRFQANPLAERAENRRGRPRDGRASIYELDLLTV